MSHSKITPARELFEEFEKETSRLEKDCFVAAVRILDNFLTGNPKSEFTQRANNLKNTYTRQLIKKLGSTAFSNIYEWWSTLIWVLDYSKEIEKITASDPQLKSIYDSFINHQPWLNELKEAAKDYKEKTHE
ncbi:MAG: hypothetical protein OEW69_10620 [Nitrospirota bacterium]|nr:hypothetical protein [Nitrospirota bacterium]